MQRPSALLTTGLLFASALSGQAQTSNAGSQDMSGMNMSNTDMSKMDMADKSKPPAGGHEMPGMGENSAPAMQSMEGHHMDMGPHMHMTALREPKPGDQEKADQVVQAARKAAEKYKNYKIALADGFKIFHPEAPQKQYHFTNYKYAFEAAFGFNPDHPTSLLYEKHGDDYKLIGVMYTARKTAGEDDLNQRIPLSIAQWHAHVNFCKPPDAQKGDVMKPNAKFGLRGSITTKEACDAAGGTFMPQIFGWMVHVYPFEQKPSDIWAVERQGHMD